MPLTSARFQQTIGHPFSASYNGQNAGVQGYRIGGASASDALTWGKNGGNPFFTPGAGWDATIVKDPYLLKVGQTWHLFYTGSDGNHSQIGHATSSSPAGPFTRDAGNPILARGAAGTWDENSVSFPVVIFDPFDADPNKRWKLWYAGSVQSSTTYESAQGLTGLIVGTDPAVGASPFSGFGNAFTFNGTNAYVNAGAKGTSVSGSGYCLEAKFRRTVGSTGTQIIAGRESGNVAGGTNGVIYASNVVSAQMRWSDGTRTVLNGTTALAANTNYDVSLDYDGTTLRLWLSVNGGTANLEASAAPGAVTIETPDTTTRFLIGAQDSGSPFFFAGVIDEVRLSKVSRHAAAYTPAASPFATDANTVLLFHLDQLSAITGNSLQTPQQIGVAFAPDGSVFTRSTSNPVLHGGGFGTYDGASMEPGAAFFDGSLWHLFYGGRLSSKDQAPDFGSNGYKERGCRVTFTDPQGTYTKDGSNPVVPGRDNAGELLTANLNSGTALITIADTTQFQQGEVVIVDDTGAGAFFTAKVLSIGSGTQLTLDTNAPRNYTVGNGAFIHSLWWGSFTPRSIQAIGGGYRLYGAAWDQAPIAVCEMSGSVTAPALSGPWTIDLTDGSMIPLGASGAWDATSAENFNVSQGQ